MRATILFIFLIFTFSVMGQEGKDWRLFPNKAEVKRIDSLEKTLITPQKEGTVTIHQPKEIDSLESRLRNTPYILGYTVQLEVSQQSSKIRDARYRLLKIKPDTPLEESYKSPNTYLYGGAFYTREDAYLFKHEISSSFPNAIVIAKKLNLPPLKKTEE